MSRGAVEMTLVRHGRTELNRAHRYQGWTDAPLDAVGRAQARRIGAMLLTRRFVPRVIWSSDLGRAVETARLLMEAMGDGAPPLRTDRRLRELHFGEWEGRTWREIRQRDQARARAWIQDPEHVTPPRGESLGALRGRVSDWLASGPESGGRVLLVGHGGPLALVSARLLALPSEWAIESRLRLPLGSVACCPLGPLAGTSEAGP